KQYARSGTPQSAQSRSASAAASRRSYGPHPRAAAERPSAFHSSHSGRAVLSEQLRPFFSPRQSSAKHKPRQSKQIDSSTHKKTGSSNPMLWQSITAHFVRNPYRPKSLTSGLDHLDPGA